MVGFPFKPQLQRWFWWLVFLSNHSSKGGLGGWFSFNTTAPKVWVVGFPLKPQLQMVGWCSFETTALKVVLVGGVSVKPKLQSWFVVGLPFTPHGFPFKPQLQRWFGWLVVLSNHSSKGGLGSWFSF